MNSTNPLSITTQRNWSVGLLLFFSALIASITGVYFLFLPVGGYQGGHNPFYGIRILFDRKTWDLIHTWSGMAMIAIASTHLVLHLKWVVSTARRLWKGMTNQCCSPLNPHARLNIAINTAIIASFLLTAISGMYFLFFPSGRSGIPDPGLILSRSTWDIVHTWSGIVLIAAGIFHFAIHWQWVAKVTRRIFTPMPLHNRIIISNPKIVSGTRNSR